MQWNLSKQTEPADEIIVMDGPGAVPDKRNEAVQRATGDILAFVDDDDWQHPERFRYLRDTVSERVPVVGMQFSYCIDIQTGAGQEIRDSAMCGAGIWRGHGRTKDFGMAHWPCEDEFWVRELGGVRLWLPDPLIFWLCHGKNLVNAHTNREFITHPAIVRRHIGRAWGETDAELAALRERLGLPCAA